MTILGFHKISTSDRQTFVVHGAQKDSQGNQQSETGKGQQNCPGRMTLASLHLHDASSAAAKKGTFLGRIEKRILRRVQLEGVGIIVAEVQDVGVEKRLVSETLLSRVIRTGDRRGTFAVIVAEKALDIENGLISGWRVIIQRKLQVTAILGRDIWKIGSGVLSSRIVTAGEIYTEIDLVIVIVKEIEIIIGKNDLGLTLILVIVNRLFLKEETVSILRAGDLAGSDQFLELLCGDTESAGSLFKAHFTHFTEPRSFPRLFQTQTLHLL